MELYMNLHFPRWAHSPFIFLFSLLILTGCGSDSSSSSDSSGYINFYNTSANSPDIYFTLDEDLDEDDDDEHEITYHSVGYAQSSGIYEVPKNEYFFELAWQDGDSSDRDDLAIVHESSIEIKDDMINFVVMDGDVSAPTIRHYDVEIIDDEEDDDDDLFNVQILNMRANDQGLDLYMSEDDETFNEAQLVGAFHYAELSDNMKFEQDSYVFYITEPGSDEVIYQSQDIDFPYSSQYILSLRYSDDEHSGIIMDKISLASLASYPDSQADANFKVFNAIKQHELLPDYNGTINFNLNSSQDLVFKESIMMGDFSEMFNIEKGDYSIYLTDQSETPILQNHLLTLNENSNKSVFLYLNEENVDHDGDGDVDEDGDGYVDEIEITINSLVVENSINQGIYDHQVRVINLVDHDDFNVVTVYFVRNDELIETTPLQATTSFANSSTIDLLNNTYQVFALTTIDSSDVILGSMELTLDENSGEKFILLQEDTSSLTGYSLTLLDQ